MSTQSPQTHGFIDSLIRRRKQSAYLLFVAAALLALLTLWAGKNQPDGYMPLCLGGSLFALVNLCLAMYQQLRDPGRYPEPAATRLFVLGFAAFNGLVLAILGLGLAAHWWDKYLEWLRGEPGPDIWKVYTSLLAVFGGLAAMFMGLQAGRGQEHADPIMRRLLYGYNTVLGAILLGAILVLLNGLAYARLSAPIDFTASSMYTLGSRSRSILGGLDRPTKIYVIMMPQSGLRSEIQTLLENCRDINNKIQVEYLDPRPTGDIEQIQNLISKYSFTARQGVLIVYGTDKDANHRFIPADDFIETDFSRTREAKFKGEDVLMTALNSLSEGKNKPVIYFTQGHGELDIANMDDSRMDQGAGVLKSRLEKRNYEVKSLNFKPGEASFPADAAIVAILGPKLGFGPEDVQALRQFVNPERPGAKKGKLVVFLDEALTPEGTMRPTGLEPLLREFNVDVGNERILRVTTRNPQMAYAIVNQRIIDRNPIAATFSQDTFQAYKARPVRPGTDSAAPKAGSFSADSPIEIPNLRLGIETQIVWTTSDLRTNPLELVDNLRKNRDLLGKTLASEPIPVVVTVTSPPDMTDPHLMSRQSSDGTPRLAVFGTSSFASNFFTSEKRQSMEYELVANMFDWVRQKPQSIGIESKNREMFTLDRSVNTLRLVLLPPALMLLAIVALGTSIWLIRRQ
jgi:gliding motility-associatede transport system auxiliary component